MSRLTAAAAVVTLPVAVLMAPQYALAGEGTASHTDEPAPGYVSAVSTSTASAGGVSKTTRRSYRRSGPVTCQAIDGRFGERRYQRLDIVTTHETGDAPEGEDGAWYARYCGDSSPAPGCAPGSTPMGCLGIPSSYWGYSGSVWWSAPDAFGAGAPVDPASVAAAAYKFLPIPEADIGFNPPGTTAVPALVNLDTWLWMDPASWAPQYSEVEVCCPSVVVRVQASPQRATFDMGDGTRVACDGPGVPYDQTRPAATQTTSCSHTYSRSSAAEPANQFSVAAAVEWTATWSISGAAPAGGGALPPARQVSDPVPIRVAEIQSLNTPIASGGAP
jgi:hypothetical protein